MSTLESKVLDEIVAFSDSKALLFLAVIIVLGTYMNGLEKSVFTMF